MIEAIRRFNDDRLLYLHNDREAIARSNALVLRYASLMTLVLLAILLAAAELMLHGWKPSPFHYALFPLCAAICVASWVMKGRSTVALATGLCIAYQVVLYGCVLLIDTVGGPEAPSSFIQLICMAMPSLFVLPATFTYGMLFAVEASYTLLVMFAKSPEIIPYDIFGMIAGVCFSVCASLLILNYHMKAYDLKMRYELLSERDTLSSLYNKRAFFEQAHRYFGEHNPTASCSLAIIDLDNFKAVNDTFGHDKGDKVLSRAGAILLDLFRPTDLVGRFGGDEYIILTHGLVNDDLLRDRFDEFRSRLNNRSMEKLGTTLTSSVGIVCAVNDPVDFDEMFHQADAAMYEAKRCGKNRCVVKPYEPGAGAGHANAAEAAQAGAEAAKADGARDAGADSEAGAMQAAGAGRAAGAMREAGPKAGRAGALRKRNAASRRRSAEAKARSIGLAFFVRE